MTDPADETQLMADAEPGLDVIIPTASGVGVARNTVLNFLGLALPLALAFFVMPVAARHLGPTRFGLLGLAWAITEYLTLFDLGLGRALVKFVADSLTTDSRRLSEIVSLSMVAQVLAGVVGGVAFVLAAPLFVHRVFNVVPSATNEALSAFRVVGVSVPVVLLMSGQRSILEGAQRFDLSASTKMLGSMAALVIPAIGAASGMSLPLILLIVLASRVLIALLYAVAIRRALPQLRWVWSSDWSLLRRILSFGGWVLVSNTISPLLVYFDRFALGSIIGLTAVGFYTGPYEGVARLLAVPISLFGTLLPALAAIEAGGQSERFARLASSSERILAPVMVLPLAFLFVFAPDVLRVWLGADYAAQSSTALRILAIGVFANAIANPLLVVLYAKDRPDLPAKFHVLELVLHVPITIVLIKAFGISGAAAAWAIRVSLDMCLLLGGVTVTSRESVDYLLGGRLRTLGVGVLVLVTGFALSRYVSRLSVPAALVLGLATAIMFVAWSWRRILTEPERLAITRGLNVFGRSLSRKVIPG